MGSTAQSTQIAQIAMIGYGNMGQALHQSWLNTNHHFHIISPNIAVKTKPSGDSNHYYSTLDDMAEALKSCDQVWLAVKPQIMLDICKDLAPLIHKDALIVSIAAGLTLDSIQSPFAAKQPTIRVMPSTPVSIGKGVLMLTANSHATSNHKETLTDLCEQAGKAYWLDGEHQMDAATALAGSGPAYLFHFIDTLAKAGQNAGLPETLAAKLARQTIIGSAALAEKAADTSTKTLRENVTSKGGSTAAGLTALMTPEFQDILNATIKAAQNRNKELGS